MVFLENEILYGESFPVTEEIMSHDFTVPIGKCKVRGSEYAFFETYFSCKHAAPVQPS